ncbi:MAG: hypothetical protein HY866_23975 [Chloroflexi bacterium]|nr:hypothetical protein [Chloroflexota bacterium]
MLAPINPEGERIRAQAILRSFTDYREAVNLFAPMSPQDERISDQVETAKVAANANHNKRRSIMQVFKAIKLNRRPVVDESVQPLAYSPRQVTTSGCSE